MFCCSVVRFKNGQGSNLDGGNYHVYENGSLEIKMIRKEDQGIYTCVATNILGKAENQVRLEVKGKGEIPGGQGKRGSHLLMVVHGDGHFENAPHLMLNPSLWVRATSQNFQLPQVLGTPGHFIISPVQMELGRHTCFPHKCPATRKLHRTFLSQTGRLGDCLP